MKKKSEKFTRYHGSFAGDTYDACARCGGKCEKFKISTLMPGEKEFMAEKLNIPLTVLEEKYFSAINTPLGNVDVLKMKNNCPFLDEEYRCTAIPAKPVLCDTYPVVFYISKGKVHFKIDKTDCPMVHWPEYDMAVKDFETKGIRALKEMKIPFTWWEKVTLYDEFDFDYIRIEKDLGRTTEYATFYLELLLGYACNGYEKRARKRGLDLMIQRLQNCQKKSEKKLGKWLSVKNRMITSITHSYRKLIEGQIKDEIDYLKKLKTDLVLMTEPNAHKYFYTINHCLNSIKQHDKYLKSIDIRLKEVLLPDEKIKLSEKQPSREVREFNPAFKIGFRLNLPELTFYEIRDERSSDFLNAIKLLSETFLPNEIDSPKRYIGHIQANRFEDGTVGITGDGSEKHSFWYKWIMVVILDGNDHVIGVADGAVIVNKRLSLFYASHIATLPRLRNAGLGSVLSAAILQVAEDNIPQGMISLGLDPEDKIPGMPLLDCELGEVEFPDTSPSGSSSLKRLPFHGRLGRNVLWPFRYAQPDTDYNLKIFDEYNWNSVPMFLAFRAFVPGKQSYEQARAAVELIFDYFITTMGKGAKWDKEIIMKGLAIDGIPSFIAFPKSSDGIPEFIDKTGILSTLLMTYYPDHKYTRDYFILNQ